MRNKLTPNQKKHGQNSYLWFTRINALSFGSLADSILILYSIRLGADDFWVAVLTSFFYLTLPLMVIGKKSIAIRGTSKTFGWCWIGRNLFASFMIFSPVVQKMWHHSAGLIFLAISVFGFFSFRSMGIAAHTPLLGDITNHNDRGDFIARVWANANFFLFLVIIVIAYVLNENSPVSTFQKIVAFGCFTGFISSIFLFKIPESAGAKKSGKEPSKKAIPYLSHDIVAKKLLVAWIFVTSGNALVLPFSMLTLKKGYSYSDQGALIFAIIQIAGGLFVSYLNRLLLDRVGPRPMLFLYTCGLCLVSLLWIISPNEFIFLNIMLIFFIAGMCSAGNSTSLSHYFLSYIPVVHRVGASLFINIISGLSAGLAGGFIGGTFLKLLRNAGIAGLDVYRIYFGVILLLLIVVLVQVFRLKPLEDRQIKDVLGALFSIRDWRALYTLQKLSESTREDKDLKLVGKLSEIASDLSEDTLIQYLDSPRFFIRTRAITALRYIKFGKKTAQKLIREVEKGEYTSAYLAAEVLGEHHIHEAIPVLRKALDSGDIFLKGKAMVALARLKNVASYEQIIKIFDATSNSRLLIHGVHSLVLIDNPDSIPILLNKIMLLYLPEQVSNELLFGLCEFFGVSELFYQLFNVFQTDIETGFLSLKEMIENNFSENPNLKRPLLGSIDRLSTGDTDIRQEIKTFYKWIPSTAQNSSYDYILKFISTTPSEKVPIELLLAFVLILSNIF